MSKNKKTNYKINKVIGILTASDIFTWGLFGSINVFVGIYLSGKPQFTPEEVIQFLGIGTAIFSFSSAIMQIPVGLTIDKLKGDRDEIYALMTGNIMFGLPFLLYPLIDSEYIYYFLQAVMGVGAAINVVSWRKLFAKNLDKDKEGMEYAGYETVLSTCTAIFSIIAGLLGSISPAYFDLVMVSIGVMMMSSGLIAFSLFRVERKGEV